MKLPCTHASFPTTHTHTHTHTHTLTHAHIHTHSFIHTYTYLVPPLEELQVDQVAAVIHWRYQQELTQATPQLPPRTWLPWLPGRVLRPHRLVGLREELLNRLGGEREGERVCGDGGCVRRGEGVWEWRVWRGRFARGV